MTKLEEQRRIRKYKPGKIGRQIISNFRNLKKKKEKKRTGKTSARIISKRVSRDSFRKYSTCRKRRRDNLFQHSKNMKTPRGLVDSQGRWKEGKVVRRYRRGNLRCNPISFTATYALGRFSRLTSPLFLSANRKSRSLKLPGPHRKVSLI